MPPPPTERTLRKIRELRQPSRWHAVHYLRRQGFSKYAIWKTLGVSQKTVKRYLEMDHPPHAQTFCRNCGADVPVSRGNRYCRTCRKYAQKHGGSVRPRHLWDKDAGCKTCRKPLRTIDGRSRYRGYCQNCIEYLKRNDAERPRDMWGIGSHGWCECGQPAEHKRDDMALCDECAAEYDREIRIYGN